MLWILAPVDADQPVHLCGIDGSVLERSSDPRPRSALLDVDVAASIAN